MAIETVAVTGGNGKIGSAVLAEASDRGYRAVNLARGKRREEVSDAYYTTDLLTAGEVYGSLDRCGADAVVHMGTIPTPTSHPGHVTFESNVASSYHVLEAAAALGLESACLASSINAMGAAYQEAPMEVDYLPVDEGHRLTPRDPYAVGKHALEVTADGFGRQDREPRTISTLRYPWVADDAELRERYVETDRSLDGLTSPVDARDVLFSYLHIEDAAAVAVDAVEADYEGHETFWTVAADTSATVPSDVLVDEFYPDAECRTEFSGTEGLVDTGKAAELLGWTPERSWRDL
jgi:nucleoside-diphosphate-sugar epimerase